MFDIIINIFLILLGLLAILMTLGAVAGVLNFLRKKLKSKRLPEFYSEIRLTDVGLYQSYINRAFELSSDLEFDKDDPEPEELLHEAESRDAVNPTYLQMMMIQYVHADEWMREQHKDNWVETVLNRKGTDFFPDPWAIASAAMSDA